MATLKVVIPPYKSRTDNKYSVRIRLTHNRDSAFLRTAYRLRAEEITPGGKIKPEGVRYQLNADMSTMEAKLKEIGLKANNYTVRELGDILERAVAIKEGVVEEGIDFLQYGRKVANQIQSRQSANYITLLNKIAAYTGNNRLDINSITKRWLKEFETWMFEQGLQPISVNNNMRVFRAIYNRARTEFNDEERGEVPVPFYPFGPNRYKMPEPEQSKSRAIEVVEIRKIRDYIATCRRDELGRDMFMLSFYMMGMNLPDIYKCDLRAKDRIIYIRSKVSGKRGKDAEISVKIPVEVAAIIDKYADNTGARVFDFYQQYASVDNFTRAVNEGLKIIKKEIGLSELTLYYARHSFATIAHTDYKASISEVGACLNHADRSNKVTLIYTKKDFTRNDQIQQGVIDIIFDRAKKGRKSSRKPRTNKTMPERNIRA